MKPGEKIRLQREEKKLDLKETAQRAQIEVDRLAKIESGEVAPPLGALIKLARVFGVRLGTFLDDQVKEGAVVTRKGENEPSDNMNVAGSLVTENLTFSSLARHKGDRHMDPFLIEVFPDETSKGKKLSAHEGEEFIFVLEGSVKIEYGQDTHLLEKGDSIYYDSIVDHRISAANGEKALILAVVYLPL